MAKTDAKKIPALFIQSKTKDGFRRCGFAFTPEGFGIALDALTKEQIKALREEPQLMVQDTDLEAPDETPATANKTV